MTEEQTRYVWYKIRVRDYDTGWDERAESLEQALAKAADIRTKEWMDATVWKMTMEKCEYSV